MDKFILLRDDGSNSRLQLIVPPDKQSLWLKLNTLTLESVLDVRYARCLDSYTFNLNNNQGFWLFNEIGNCCKQLNLDYEKCQCDWITCDSSEYTYLTHGFRGKIVKRPETNINPHMSTGEVELEVESIECMVPSATQLPFYPSKTKHIDANEQVESGMRDTLSVQFCLLL